MSAAILKAIRFVRGSVDTAQFVPAFKHFAIRNGMVQGSDGVVTMCAGLASSLAVMAHAQRFVAAVMACADADEIDLSLTPAGQLRVTAGKFRAIVPAGGDVEKEFPWSDPASEDLNQHSLGDSGAAFLAALKAVRPFVGNDATRPWAQGVLVHHGRLYATNNVCIVETAPVVHPNVDTMIIPATAIDEVLRVGLVPRAIANSTTAVYFMYAKTWWIRASLIPGSFPDVTPFFGDWAGRYSCERVDDSMREAFARLRPFLDPAGPVYLIDKRMSSSFNETDEGALVEGMPPMRAAFVSGMLRVVLEAATHVDTTPYPKACAFLGPTLRGVVSPYVNQAMKDLLDGKASTHTEAKQATKTGRWSAKRK